MTRELLEMAAKAAGIVVSDWLPGSHGFAIESAPGHVRRWNPLTDDGDALRLAVKLGLEVWTDDAGFVRVMAREVFDVVVEAPSADPYAATRRAITRAAAEIGRTMK